VRVKQQVAITATADPIGKEATAVSIKLRAVKLALTLLKSSKLPSVGSALEAIAEAEVVPNTTAIASISQLQLTPSTL